MMKINRFVEHILSFSTEHLRAFFYLCCAAFLQGSLIVFFDSLSSGLYLGYFGSSDLAFDFLMASLVLIGSGYFVVRLNKLFGSGFLLFLSFFLLTEIALFWGIHHGYWMAYEIFFVSKWAFRAVLFTGFWAVAFRFVELNLKSKRFLTLIVCEMLGFCCAGLWTYMTLYALGRDVFFVFMIVATVLLWGCLWRAFIYEKITPELQLKKNAGVNEQSQKLLLYLIYTTAFFFMAIYALIDYTLCLQALKNTKNIEATVRFFSVVWTLFGASSLFLIGTLYSLRRSFHITTPLIILAFLPLIASLGWNADILWIVLFSKVVLEIIAYFCVGYYFRMMPRPLSYGAQSRLVKSRLTIAEPAGFAFTALVFYFIPYQSSSLLFSCILSIAFLFVLIDDQNEYARVLLSAFRTFRWQGGRLIIRNPQVLQFLEEKVNSRNPQEVIYYLRVMEEAQVSDLKKHLHHALTHTSPLVRRFALESIERNNLRMFKKTLSDVMDKDTDLSVRQKALEVFCSLGEKYAPEKAILYIEDENLKKGALTGLLKMGGEGVLLASEGLNNLVSSRNFEQRLQAAEIMQEAPRKGFYHLVLKLMNDKDIRVRRAALLAAGQNGHTALLEALFKALDNMELRDCALSALKSYGAKAYPRIYEALEDDQRTELCQKTLISYLWIAQDFEAKRILLRALKKMPLKLRIYALHCLRKTVLNLSLRQRRKFFIPLLETDFKQALTSLLLIKDLRFSPTFDAQNTFELLCDSLYSDFLFIRESILMELSFLFPVPLMQQATDILLNQDSSDAEKKVAEGTVDDLLPKSFSHFQLIVKDVKMDIRLNNLPSRVMKNDQSMTGQFSFILRSKSYRSLWTKVCALACIRRLNDVSLVSDVAELLEDKSPVVRENALWTLDRLIENKKQRKQLFTPCLEDKNTAVRKMASDLLK